MAILKNTFGEMKDTLGEAFLPILTDVVGVFMDLANNTQVNDFLTSFSDRIKGVLGAVQSMAEGKSGVATILQSLGIDPVKVHEIMALIQPLMDAFGELGSAFRASLPAIQEMFGRVKDAAQASFGAALPAIFANLTVAVSTITEFWKAHGEEIIAALEFTFRTIVAVVSGALVLVTGIIRVGLQLLSGVFDFFGKLMKGDWEGAWLSIQNTAAAVWATIVTTFNGFMNAVLGAFGTNFEAFKAQWSENWEMLKTITGLLWDKIVQGIKDKVAEWKAIGKSIVDGLKQGLIDNWNGVIKWLKDAAQRLIDSVMNMFDMKSPSGVFEDIGENLTKGLAIGITGGIAAPVKSMEGMASSLTSAAAGAGSGGGFGGSIVINVSGAGDPREVARQVARELTSQLKMQGLNSFTNALGGG
jgi:phage-related protein